MINVTCPFVNKSIYNEKYNIVGELIDYDIMNKCTIDGEACRYCTRIEVLNMNVGSKVRRYRPDWKDEVILYEKG